MPEDRPADRPRARMAVALAVLVGAVVGADIAALRWKPERDAQAPAAEAPPPPERLPPPARGTRTEPAAAGRIRVWPRSAPVERGLPYRFRLGPCGLEHVVDFDGSFWDLPAGAEQGRPPPFFVDGDRGTMTLIGPREALYRSSHGEAVHLRRHPGPKVVYPCD